MEHSYGLAITINMVMTSMLMVMLLFIRYPRWRGAIGFIFLAFLSIEFVFLLSNLGKIIHGGWFTLILSITFFVLLYLYYKAKQLRSNITEYVPMRSVIPLMEAVHADKGIMFEATN